MKTENTRFFLAVLLVGEAGAKKRVRVPCVPKPQDIHELSVAGEDVIVFVSPTWKSDRAKIDPKDTTRMKFTATHLESGLSCGCGNTKKAALEDAKSKFERWPNVVNEIPTYIENAARMPWIEEVENAE